PGHGRRRHSERRPGVFAGAAPVPRRDGAVRGALRSLRGGRPLRDASAQAPGSDFAERRTVDRGAGRHSGMTTALLLILALTACLGFVFLTAWKPVLGCGLFALLISLTTGLGRGTIVPLLRPNEAILLMLLAGLLIRRLGHWEQRPITSLDLALGCFAVGGIVTPALVLFVSRSPDLYSVDTLRNVLAPAQLFLVYLVFSRTPMSEHERAVVLNFTMAASIIVGLIAVAELID